MAIRITNIIHPLDIEPDVGIGVLLPFNSNTQQLFPSSYTTEQQAKSNLINCILTQKGERYLQPDYGTNILKQLFEQSTQDLFEYIKQDIASAVEYWLPYIKLNDVQVTPYDPNGNDQIHTNQIYITIKFQVTNNGSEQSVSLTVDVPEIQ